MFIRTYDSSRVKRKSFCKKSELQMFLLFSRGHITGAPKRWHYTLAQLSPYPCEPANVKCTHIYIARFWREILCGNLRNTTSSLQQNEGTNNILFISIKGKKLISHNSSFICWFEEESTSLEETHKRRLPLYNKWWNREFTLEKEWIRFALASQGNNSCISFFMTKKALYVRFTIFGYVESLI